VTGTGDLATGELRELLRQHALVIAPGESLIVMVPPDWQPRDVRELNDALSAICADPVYGTGFRVLAVPGTAITVAPEPPDPFPDL
jgi:hypothetical protein